jgi:mono/diheme cytochrome c family protein
VALAAFADEGENNDAATPPTAGSVQDANMTHNADRLALGERIYARTCSVCHGERGNAASWAKNSLNPPPRDFTSAAARQLSRARMIGAVTHGVRDTAMISFTTQFSSGEIEAVVDYVRSAFMEHDADEQGERGHAAAASGAPAHAGHQDHAQAHGGKADMTAAFPVGLTGNVQSGKSLYENNCVACHGIEGDGRGPRAYFLSRKPRDFTSQRAGDELNRPHLFEAVAKGVRQTEMAAWSKVLSAQQIADVSEYVLSAFISESSGSSVAAPESHVPADSKKN